MQSSLDINWWQLAIFMLVLLVPLVVNFRFSLGLTREMTLAVVRMSLQLVLVGLYLQFLFELNNPLLNLMWLTVMLLVGTSAIISSSALEAKHLYLPVLIGLLLGLVPLLLLLLLALLQPVPVYNAQYLIPLAGMLLGNSLSGNIVALQRLFTAFRDKSDEYEGALALGATPPQASLPFVQLAMQQAFAPILASMATTGLVTLPGMMTGQILGGVDPITAVKYQLVILVAIFVMLSISVTTSLYLGIRTSIAPTGLVKVKFKAPKRRKQRS